MINVAKLSQWVGALFRLFKRSGSIYSLNERLGKQIGDRDGCFLMNDSVCVCLRGQYVLKGHIMRTAQLLKLSTITGAGLFVAACASSYDIDTASNMMPSGDAFTAALHKHYIESARFEEGEGDWASVKFFNTNALTAAGGVAPALQPTSDRNLKVDVDYIGAAHNRLGRALASNAPSVSPDACALSQVWLEHWMEQSAEGHQPDDIGTARNGYEQAIPDCAAGPEPMPTAAGPSDFIVYFAFNSAELSATGTAVVANAAKYLNAHPGTLVSLQGHTDRSGNSGYNDRLSRQRVASVQAALMAAGVSAIASTAGHGEMRPEVMTGDGIKKAENRRVEINFVN